MLMVLSHAKYTTVHDADLGLSADVLVVCMVYPVGMVYAASSQSSGTSCGLSGVARGAGAGVGAAIGVVVRIGPGEGVGLAGDFVRSGVPHELGTGLAG